VATDWEKNLFERGTSYKGKGNVLTYHPSACVGLAKKWAGFMKRREKLKDNARKFYKGFTLRKCRENRAIAETNRTTSWQKFNKDTPTVILDDLPSTRISLYGAHRITVRGEYRIRMTSTRAAKTTSCKCFVEFRFLTWTWYDRTNLVPGKETDLGAGKKVDDAVFRNIGIGTRFGIRLHWADRKAAAVWDYRKKEVPQWWEYKQIEGWPLSSKDDS